MYSLTLPEYGVKVNPETLKEQPLMTVIVPTAVIAGWITVESGPTVWVTVTAERAAFTFVSEE